MNTAAEWYTLVTSTCGVPNRPLEIRYLPRTTSGGKRLPDQHQCLSGSSFQLAVARMW